MILCSVVKYAVKNRKFVIQGLGENVLVRSHCELHIMMIMHNVALLKI